MARETKFGKCRFLVRSAGDFFDVTKLPVSERGWLVATALARKREKRAGYSVIYLDCKTSRDRLPLVWCRDDVCTPVGKLGSRANPKVLAGLKKKRRSR